VTLLNATPFWGLNLPGWSGHLPAPALAKRTGRFLFDRIRDYNTIREYLKACYGNAAAFDEQLVQDIRACTNGPGGHAAFASILWSPPVKVSLPDLQEDAEWSKGSALETAAASEQADFEACLQALQCDVLLAFGGADPWCKPAFAKRMLQRLSRRRLELQQRYVELSGVGHCPNHEAPKAVAQVLTAWLQQRGDEAGEVTSLVPAGGVVVEEEWGKTVMTERAESEIEVTWADRLATNFL